MRFMYDSDVASAVPDTGWDMLAGYVDGGRTRNNYDQLRARFPDALIVKISAVGAVDGDVIDIEPGNVWPPSAAVPWIIRQRARGGDPSYYCNTSTRRDCLAAFAAAGIAEPHWWRADYNNVRELEMGEVAHQFADPPMLNGLHCDASVVADFWPGVDDNLTPLSGGSVPLVDPTAPQPAPEDDMTPEQDQLLRSIFNATQNGIPMSGEQDQLLRSIYNATQNGIPLSAEEDGLLRQVFNLSTWSYGALQQLADKAGVDPAQLAAALAPLLTNSVAHLNDADLAAVAKATQDEADKRAKARLA
jgi:hypothetical protein